MSLMQEQMDVVLAYCTEHEIDLTTRAPHKIYKKIADATPITESQAKTAMKNVRKALGYNTKVAEEALYKTIEEYLISVGAIPEKIPYGTAPKAAKTLNLPLKTIQVGINKFRRQKKIVVRSKETCETPDIETINPLSVVCKDLGIVRSNPCAEKIGSQLIIKCMKEKIPTGGAAMIFGTATPFCSSLDAANNHMLLSDNEQVAHILEFTTDLRPIVVIGNGVNEEKAYIKYMLWKTNNSTSHYDIKLDIVNRESLMLHAIRMADVNPFCKLIIMTSGTWEGSNTSYRKWGMDTNFRAPCEFLTKRYPNMHIVAMVTGGKEGNYWYRVNYLHNGVIETIE